MASNSNNPSSTLTGARQTMLSWAKVIESYAAVPGVYQDFCKPLLEDGRPFPYMVLAPAISGNRYKATEKLLCEVDDVFYVWECVGSSIVSAAYPLKTICALEVGSILLYSWLTVRGVTSEGAASYTVIPFNTATGRHLAPFIHKMRPAPTDTDEAGWRAELAKFDYLAAVSFKFMNYARESLVRGEKVIQTVWQPPIRQHRFTLFGRPFHRTIALAHLALLTDQEVVFIGDDKHSVDNRGVRYGGIWQYIPLWHIAAAALTEPADDLVTLSLTLAGGDQRLDKVFAASSRPALEHFQNELKHGLE